MRLNRSVPLGSLAVFLVMLAGCGRNNVAGGIRSLGYPRRAGNNLVETHNPRARAHLPAALDGGRRSSPPDLVTPAEVPGPLPTFFSLIPSPEVLGALSQAHAGFDSQALCLQSEGRLEDNALVGVSNAACPAGDQRAASDLSLIATLETTTEVPNINHQQRRFRLWFGELPVGEIREQSRMVIVPRVGRRMALHYTVTSLCTGHYVGQCHFEFRDGKLAGFTR